MGKPDVDEVEIAAGAKAISYSYGSVIGDSQARNIAYNVLTAARGAKSRAEAAAEQAVPERRRSDWHYDSQGYCDNPGRGY